MAELGSLLATTPEFAIDIAAGSVGGFCSKFLDYPLDTAKVLIQSQPKQAPKYKSTYDCLAQSVQQKGFLSLYNGLGSRLLGSMAENAVCFLAYAGLKRELQQLKNGQSLSLLDLSLAGAGSGAAVSLIMTPVELIKCRMQVSSQQAKPLYKSSIDCALQTIRQEGGVLRGLYKGHLSTMCREVPGNFVWYLTYELGCDALVQAQQVQSREDLTVRDHMTAGAVAGVMYWAAIFPVDTVKTILQTSLAPSATAGEIVPQVSLGQAFKTVYQEQGLRGLYRGFGATAARSAPANAVLFAGYEQTVQFFKSL